MEPNRYLQRIGFEAKPEATKEVLFQLQKNHLLHIPFENLDIHYGTEIVLDPARIYTKIILNKRGGFCYELNSLFCALLTHIGFDARLVSGKVHVEAERYGPEFDHMAIVVQLEGRLYLVDVGFGKFSCAPLEITPDLLQEDENGVFVIEKLNAVDYRVSRIEHSVKTPEYIFSLQERQLNEFEAMCRFHQSSAESHFTKSKVVSIATADGRITLNDASYKITRDGHTETGVFEEGKFEEHLQQFFGMKIRKDVDY